MIEQTIDAGTVANSVQAALIKKRDKIAADLWKRFHNATDDMIKHGKYSISIDLDEEELPLVTELITVNRDFGYRFRLDRFVTMTVNSKGEQIGESQEEFQLFISVEHLS